MDLFQIIVLAIVQGVTEFLPVSSSGHLVIIEDWLAGRGPADQAAELTVNIFLHLGTLLAVLVFYFRPIMRLLTQDRRAIGLLFVGTLPAAVLGLAIKSLIPELVTNSLLSGCLLPVTGLILLASARLPEGQVDYNNMSYAKALAIGFAQACAVLPGISRSGLTIVAGLALGLRRESAATFSFLLSIPVIGGAAVVEGHDLLQSGKLGVQTTQLVIGAAVAMGVGLLALTWLVRWLRQGRLYLFAWWCFALGAAVIAWHLLGPADPVNATSGY